MRKKNKGTKRALLSSNLFSLLGSTTAICCAGPGLAGCAASCAPACGSLGLSIFGLSSIGLTHWIQQYWYVFLILSILSFSEAAYRIFYLNRKKIQKRARFLFFLSLIISIILFGNFLFSC